MQAIESGSGMKREGFCDTRIWFAAQREPWQWDIVALWFGIIFCGVVELGFAVWGFISFLQWVAGRLHI